MWRFGVAMFAALSAPPAVARQVCVSGDAALIARVCYSDHSGPVGYDHKILGDTPEWTELVFYPGPAGMAQGLKPWALGFEHGFFEDTAPRLADVDGDGLAEIIAVHTDLDKGARLVVIGRDETLMAATAFIGTAHRWLAPVGVGDFDGDGRLELAYVDRPHLVRELVFVRPDGDRLREIARVPGLSAHRIGDTNITSAVRTCAGGRAEVLLPDGEWQRLMTVRLTNRRGVVRDLGKMTDTALAKAAAQPCA